MSDEDKQKSTGKLTAYERWELPNLENNKVTEDTGPAILIQKDTSITTEEVDQDSLVYEPLTASQLEEIRSAAYDEGFIQGEADGHEKGYQDGFSKGEPEGFEKGHAEGLAQGREEGEAAAKEVAQGQLESLEKLLTDVVNEITHPLEESRAAAETILYQTMTRLIENVCLSQMKEDAHHVLKTQLTRVFDEIGEYEGRIRLRLHPNDVSVLEALAVADRLALQIDEDESLMEGGFLLDSKAFHVDGRVEQRLASVCDELRHLSSPEE
ncbi:FliH/SctL family protein [Marinomonas pollencensis]|uniref:Flagellar assembly protein FliH n=1 Tax=Marinomonas pollencensis TaxID=491954 RepID=A0A3E0DJP1_9GAMM|nr:FliH/SctL family protein [Marinomonas pollencensis]REG82929.1 flagellar assembly protein FliH [Marinomonas pollencensis]